MKNKLGIVSFFVLVCSVASAQYKHDIGIKISSLEEERTQLDYRFHLTSPYTIVATYAYGSNVTVNEEGISSFSDSSYTTYSAFQKYWSNTVKIGVQRRISGFASNVFYTGATFGIGYIKQQNSTSESTYFYNDTLPPPSAPFMPAPGSEVSFNELHRYSKLFQAQLALTFGMDVPISKRFLFNAEVGLIGNVGENMAKNGLSAEVRMAFSGGVRYQFGKQE